MEPYQAYIIAIVCGVVVVTITAYWIYEAATGIRTNLYPLLEEVIELMEIEGIDYNQELYSEVYFFAKGVGANFRYNGRRVEDAIKTLHTVRIRLLNKNYKNVYRDMCEILEALEDYFEKLERIGKL